MGGSSSSTAVHSWNHGQHEADHQENWQAAEWQAVEWQAEAWQHGWHDGQHGWHHGQHGWQHEQHGGRDWQVVSLHWEGWQHGDWQHASWQHDQWENDSITADVNTPMAVDMENVSDFDMEAGLDAPSSDEETWGPWTAQ